MRRAVLRLAVGVAGVVALVVMVGSARVDTAGADVQAVPGGAQLVGDAASAGLFVGIVAERRRAAAFVSDGKRVGLWLAGGVRNGDARLSDGAGNTLTLQLSSSSATGRLQLAGQSSTPVKATGAVGGAGLYARVRRLLAEGRVKQETIVWLRLRDGRLLGVRRLENPGGAPTIGPAPLTLTGATRITPEALLLRCKPATQAGPAGVPASYPLGCRLPAAVTPVAPTSTFRVIANPKGSRLSAEQLRAIAATARVRIGDQVEKAGLRFLTDADRLLSDGWAANLRKNAKVLQAAGTLRAALLSGKHRGRQPPPGRVRRHALPAGPHHARQRAASDRGDEQRRFPAAARASPAGCRAAHDARARPRQVRDHRAAKLARRLHHVP